MIAIRGIFSFNFESFLLFLTILKISILMLILHIINSNFKINKKYKNFKFNIKILYPDKLLQTYFILLIVYYNDVFFFKTFYLLIFYLKKQIYMIKSIYNFFFFFFRSFYSYNSLPINHYLII